MILKVGSRWRHIDYGFIAEIVGVSGLYFTLKGKINGSTWTYNDCTAETVVKDFVPMTKWLMVLHENPFSTNV